MYKIFNKSIESYNLTDSTIIPDSIKDDKNLDCKISLINNEKKTLEELLKAYRTIISLMDNNKNLKYQKIYMVKKYTETLISLKNEIRNELK
jgi:hypothetical protein